MIRNDGAEPRLIPTISDRDGGLIRGRDPRVCRPGFRQKVGYDLCPGQKKLAHLQDHVLKKGWYTLTRPRLVYSVVAAVERDGLCAHDARPAARPPALKPDHRARTP